MSSNPLNLARLPDWLSKLNLFRLNFAKTGITGHLPRWLSSTSISMLDLSSNQLSGSLPHWIGNMTNLSILNLSNNGFHSSIPLEFKNLSLLMDLDLHSNKFTGNLGTIFSKSTKDLLDHYNSIDVSRNRFVSHIDDNFGNKASMESIQVLLLS
ncbi:hypothetical protein MKW94_003271 [Papaver nudicaule]|uniref:Uncharacterized protein n=1 Tax=Papaver nudicaule TaxID=74823 RepID=A0AA41V1G0_PAPNU|nr:hypothetical protein [Papaver nudicaule]